MPDVRTRTVPPQLWFVVSATFHYLGPAFAVLLFARVDVLGVAWLRIATAALVLGLWSRPGRTWAAADHPTRRLLVAWGAVLAVMNCCFYLAIDRLPLGTVAAIEFVPVVGLAALGLRTQRNTVALAMAVAGVYLLTHVVLVDDPLGVALAVANALLFCGYVVLGHRVATETGVGPVEGLAISMLVATVVAAPVGLTDAVDAVTDPVALAAAAGVGVCSSVVPYLCDQLAMAQLPRATYALMVALLPATATVVGALVLRQVPTAAEATGVALVVAAVAIHDEVEP